MTAPTRSTLRHAPARGGEAQGVSAARAPGAPRDGAGGGSVAAAPSVSVPITTTNPSYAECTSRSITSAIATHSAGEKSALSSSGSKSSTSHTGMSASPNSSITQMRSWR